MGDDVLVVVFAKAPIPGEAKTRLIPLLGASGAAMLHAALVERVIENALATHYDVAVSCAGDVTHPFFEECAETFDIALAEQGTGDLGQRMFRALNEGLLDYAGVVIVGADCPAVTATHFLEAAKQLRDNDVILIPADDGGYVLIAARSTHPSMFHGIDWGSGVVLEQQLAALRVANLRVAMLPALWDVDRPEDLSRLKALKPALSFHWHDPTPK
jgi:uncharacterized protein